MGAKEIKRYCIVKEAAEKLLETAINKLGLSARAYSRVLKVGRTIADLAGSESDANLRLAGPFDHSRSWHRQPPHEFYMALSNCAAIFKYFS